MLKPNSLGVFDDNVEAGKYKIARKLLSQGHPPDKVAKACGLSLADVKHIQHERVKP